MAGRVVDVLRNETSPGGTSPKCARREEDDIVLDQGHSWAKSFLSAKKAGFAVDAPQLC